MEITEYECPLCCGSGEVSIGHIGDNSFGTYGCPVCIQRELEEEISDLTEKLTVLALTSQSPDYRWVKYISVDDMFKKYEEQGDFNTHLGVDIILSDGTQLRECIPQMDGDLWWDGLGFGSQFLNPSYLPITHWRFHLINN